MTKYITRDKLADFVEQMYNAGIKCDIKPKESQITLWSEDLNKIEYVDVVDKRSYENLIHEVMCSLLQPYNPSHTINAKG